MKNAFSRFGRRMASLARLPFDTFLEIGGLACVAYGASLVFLPAGVIVAGLALCFLGFALGSDAE